MGLFNSDAKKEALQRLEKAQRDYESNGKRANTIVQSLYEKKKEAIEAIESAERILIKQPDFGTDNIRKIADAKSSIRLFQEAMQKEKIALKSKNDTLDGFTKAGAAGEPSNITFSIALATTFTAAGTAISAISGGTAGYVAGSAILAMAGPIGWVIGGITVATGSFFIRKNNKRVVNKINETTEEVKSINGKLENIINELKIARDEISSDIIALDVFMKGAIIDGQARYNYPEIVAVILSLCKNISKKFSI